MREYLVVVLVAAAMTYLFTVIAREIAVRTGAVAKLRDRDVHAEPVPYLGGLAMLGGLFAAYAIARELPFLGANLGPFGRDDALGVLLAGALICAVGVLDDIFDLDALTKFGGQVLAVGVLVASGVQYNYFLQPGGEQFSLDRTQGALLTAFVVLATVNAVNFIDGLDGLAAGVIGIGAAALCLMSFFFDLGKYLSTWRPRGRVSAG
jgi:UDP-GlcNAc:undecaprenyl-phosphate GlcNAc-1-phosphate transferase